MDRYGGDILYHYTDFQAVDGILRQAQLRVNNVLRMNDSAEMRHFMDRLCDAVVKRLEEEGSADRAGEIRTLVSGGDEKGVLRLCRLLFLSPGRRGPVGEVRKPGTGGVYRLSPGVFGKNGFRGPVAANGVL